MIGRLSSVCGLLRRVVWCAGWLVACCAFAGTARAEAIFRPLVADPRESLSRWRIVTSVEDWRYGTDITDSTSRGGYVQDRERIVWEGAAGHTFRGRPWHFASGSPVPWSVVQIGVPAAIFSTFDNSGSLLNTDFQFGVAMNFQWGEDRTPHDISRRLRKCNAAVRSSGPHLAPDRLSPQLPPWRRVPRAVAIRPQPEWSCARGGAVRPSTGQTRGPHVRSGEWPRGL